MSVSETAAPSNERWLWLAALISLGLALGLWLAFTPGGALGKADAVGYAVCHRITVRSFAFPDGRPLPMCARCSGTFLGVLAGLFGPGLLFRRGKAISFPPAWMLIALVLFSAWWAFDGANSFIKLMGDPLPRLYEPTNPLRLVTGTFHGITMGSLILPVVNETLWKNADKRPTLAHPLHLVALLGIGALIIAAVLSGWAVVLYPLALLSAVGALAMLAAVGTMLITLLLRRQNTAETFVQALPLMLLGLALAVALIGGIDAGRYFIFGTWEGMSIPTA